MTVEKTVKKLKFLAFLTAIGSTADAHHFSCGEDFLLLLMLIVVHHSSGLSETLSESVNDCKVCLLFILRTLLNMRCRALHDWT